MSSVRGTSHGSNHGVSSLPPLSRAASPGAAKKPVAIADAEARFCWPAGGWQDRLLHAADAAGNHDGKVSPDELDRYLANPVDLQFLTSTTLRSLGAKTSVAPLAVSSLKGWAAAAGKAADTNHDGKLSADEFTAFTQKAQRNLTSLGLEGLGAKVAVGPVKVSALNGYEGFVGGMADANKDNQLSAAELAAFAQQDPAALGKPAPAWMADQKTALLESDLAELTGQKNDLLPRGFTGTVLDRTFMRSIEDPSKLDPQIVSYTLSAADQALTPANVTRPKDNPFHGDAGWAKSPGSSSYNGTGFDQGHMKPAEDSPSEEAMYDSFLMTNMAPQTGVLNEASWAYMEGAIRQLVAATGGTATVQTGNLYLDAHGTPLPPDQVKTAGPDKIAVPTHCFKSVLLQLPDGKKQAFAFVVPNSPDLSRKLDDGIKTLQASRVSVAQLQTMLGGVTLYPTLTSADAALLTNANPAISFPSSPSTNFASLLWPQGPAGGTH